MTTGTDPVEEVDGNVEAVDAVQWWIVAGVELRGLGPFLLGKQGKTLPLCKQVTAMTAAILKDIERTAEESYTEGTE